MKGLLVILLSIIYLNYAKGESEGKVSVEETKHLLLERLNHSEDASERKFIEAVLYPHKYDSNSDRTISSTELRRAIYNIFFSSYGALSLTKEMKKKIKKSIRQYVSKVKSNLTLDEMSEFILNIQPHNIFNFEEIINSQKSYSKNGDL